MSAEIPEWLRFSLSEEAEASLRRHLRYPDEGDFFKDVSPAYSHSRVRIVAPYEHTHKFRVKPKEEGSTLEDLLCARFPFRSRSGWREKIAQGLVLLGGRATSASEVLRQNVEICHRNIGVVEPSVPDDVRILYENERLLLIDKPAPMPVHPGGRYNKNTVISVLTESGYPGLHIVHRLDSVTSGLLLFAKDAEAARIMQQFFVGGRVSKRYEAVVRGVPSEDEKVITRGIVRRRGYEFMCSDGEESSAA
ncbi:MAG: hypothetical protein LAT57_14300, partial [Balneolales bacterium]|nr:hypothetical protein [Balneolales bacterium]